MLSASMILLFALRGSLCSRLFSAIPENPRAAFPCHANCTVKQKTPCSEEQGATELRSIMVTRTGIEPMLTA